MRDQRDDESSRLIDHLLDLQFDSKKGTPAEARAWLQRNEGRDVAEADAREAATRVRSHFAARYSEEVAKLAAAGSIPTLVELFTRARKNEQRLPLIEHLSRGLVQEGVSLELVVALADGALRAPKPVAAAIGAALANHAPSLCAFVGSLLPDERRSETSWLAPPDSATDRDPFALERLLAQPWVDLGAMAGKIAKDDPRGERARAYLTIAEERSPRAGDFLHLVRRAIYRLALLTGFPDEALERAEAYAFVHEEATDLERLLAAAPPAVRGRLVRRAIAAKPGGDRSARFVASLRAARRAGELVEFSDSVAAIEPWLAAEDRSARVEAAIAVGDAIRMRVDELGGKCDADAVFRIQECRVIATGEVLDRVGMEIPDCRLSRYRLTLARVHVDGTSESTVIDQRRFHNVEGELVR